jgi:F-type H+-transporting ATPase subunit b
MPQIAQIGEIYASQLLWLAIFFGAIFVVIGLGMLPKIQSTVDARDAKIAADLEVARGAREAADALEESYRAEMDKSRGEAARLAAEAKVKAAKSTEQSVGKADAAIAT